MYSSLVTLAFYCYFASIHGQESLGESHGASRNRNTAAVSSKVPQSSGRGVQGDMNVLWGTNMYGIGRVSTF